MTEKEMLGLFGLGPRNCSDCGTEFTPPPYMMCKEMKYCDKCGQKRFMAWAKTDEGKKEIKEIFEGKIKVVTDDSLPPDMIKATDGKSVVIINNLSIEIPCSKEILEKSQYDGDCQAGKDMYEKCQYNWLGTCVFDKEMDKQ